MASARLPHSEHYSFEVLDEGIGFGRARTEGTALSNTGIVDLGDSTLVFDTSLALRSAREIRAVSTALTGRAPSLSVNSHWHLDHMLGNQVFADRTIYATKRTIEILLEKRVELQKEMSRAKLTEAIQEFERQRSAASSDVGRTEFDAILRVHRTLLQEVLDINFTLPSKEFQRVAASARLLPVRGPGFDERVRKESIE